MQIGQGLSLGVTGFGVAVPEVPLLTIVANLEEGDTHGLMYYYFPGPDLTYVTTDKHDSMMLLKDSGREYEPQTPETLLFQNTLKKADKVTVVYVDGSKYYGGITMDRFYGFLRHGEGNLRDGENLLLSMGRYYQNECVVSKHDDCHNPDFCVNKENTYGFGTDSSGRLLMHPTICENCDTFYFEVKGVQLDDLVGADLQNHLRLAVKNLESHLIEMFSKAFNSSHSNAVVVRNRFFTSPWERRTMIHNLLNRKVIRDRVIADFRAIVKYFN